MSLASNATDEQIGSILETIQASAPELSAQAVAYYRVADIGWLAFTVPLTGILLTFCYRWAKEWGESDYETGAVLSGLFALASFIVSLALAGDLVKSYVATDYYAAECIARLMGKVLGN